MKKCILIINCYVDELRQIVRRRTKVPKPMAPAFLAGMFSTENCDIVLYDELYSGPLENKKLLSPDMLVLTGLNTAFDRMLHITAYAKTINPKVVVVAGGPAVRSLPFFSSKFFDYCLSGDVEDMEPVIEEVLGKKYVSETLSEFSKPIPRYDLVWWMEKMAYLESSRYCFHNCHFCSLTPENMKFQAYETEYIKRQFEVLGKRKYVIFLDNNFGCPNSKILDERFKLMQEMRAKGYYSLFAALVSNEFFNNSKNVENAAKSGAGVLFCGVESFNRDALSSLKKYQNMKIPQVETIKTCLEAGITFLYGLVLDVSERSVEDMEAELDFILNTPEITLPSYISVAIPMLKTPYFYECLSNNKILPNVKLRDLDSTTLTLRPMDPMEKVLEFIKNIQTLKHRKIKVLRHSKQFYQLYKNTLTWQHMAFALHNTPLLCAPKLVTGSGNPFKKKRTHLGPDEALDTFYKPAFPVDYNLRHYFKPTMLTDKTGNISENLAVDLLSN